MLLFTPALCFRVFTSVRPCDMHFSRRDNPLPTRCVVVVVGDTIPVPTAADFVGADRGAELAARIEGGEFCAVGR